MLHENMYKLGTVPTTHAEAVRSRRAAEVAPAVDSRRAAELAPAVDYLGLWKFDTMADCIEQILNSHPDSNVFLVKDSESRAIGSVIVHFDVIYALNVPAGEKPPACLRLSGVEGEAPLKTFADYSLEWADVKELLVESNGTKKTFPLLKKFSEMHKGRVFVLQYKGRKIRNADDTVQARWQRVSTSPILDHVSIRQVLHLTIYYSFLKTVATP